MHVTSSPHICMYECLCVCIKQNVSVRITVLTMLDVIRCFLFCLTKKIKRWLSLIKLISVLTK